MNNTAAIRTLLPGAKLEGVYLLRPASAKGARKPRPR